MTPVPTFLAAMPAAINERLRYRKQTPGSSSSSVPVSTTPPIPTVCFPGVSGVRNAAETMY